MAIIGVEQNYYQNSVATTKSTKNVNSTEKFILEKARLYNGKKWNYLKRNFMKIFLRLPIIGQ